MNSKMPSITPPRSTTTTDDTMKTTTTTTTTPRKAVLIDLSGTVHVGGDVIPGAIEACRKLQQSGLYDVKFVTNTSTISKSCLVQQLRDMGFTSNDIPSESILTSTSASIDYLCKHHLRPYCLIEDSLRHEFEKDGRVNLQEPHNCVLVGLAPSAFQYDKLNKAFRLLLRHEEQPQPQTKDARKESNTTTNSSSTPLSSSLSLPTTTKDNPPPPPPPTPRPLIAIHRAKYYRASSTDEELSLGPGGFVSCLEEASGTSAIVMGKPSPEFFHSALPDDIVLDQTVMIGDDAIQDCAGAKHAGIGVSILVQTGKYRPGDECRDGVDHTRKSIVEAIDFILEKAAEKE